MPSAPLSVWLSAMALTTAAALVVYLVAASRPTTTARQLLTNARAETVRDLTLNVSGVERFAQGLIGGLRDIGSRITPVSVTSETDRRIAQAGLSDRWTADRLIAVKALISLSVFLVLFLLAVTSGSATTLLLAVGLALVSFFVPDLILIRRGSERNAEIRDQLADIADQILVAVEAGASLDTAIDRVTRASDGPLQAEFRRMLQDVGFGMSRKDALHEMVGRTSVPELREMLLAIAQSEEHGLSIGKILRVQAGEIRNKRQLRAEERAMKIPVKIVFPLILCIMPCLLAIIAGPAIVRITENINF